MGQTIISAIGVYISTSIDYLIILIILFAQLSLVGNVERRKAFYSSSKRSYKVISNWNSVTTSM